MSIVDGFLFFKDWEKSMRALSKRDFFDLFWAMYDFQMYGKAFPEFSGKAQIIQSFIEPQLRRRLQNSASGIRGIEKKREKECGVISPEDSGEGDDFLPSFGGLTLESLPPCPLEAPLEAALDGSLESLPEAPLLTDRKDRETEKNNIDSDVEERDIDEAYGRALAEGGMDIFVGNSVRTGGGDELPPSCSLGAYDEAAGIFESASDNFSSASEQKPQEGVDMGGDKDGTADAVDGTEEFCHSAETRGQDNNMVGGSGSGAQEMQDGIPQGGISRGGAAGENGQNGAMRGGIVRGGAAGGNGQIGAVKGKAENGNAVKGNAEICKVKGNAVKGGSYGGQVANPNVQIKLAYGKHHNVMMTPVERGLIKATIPDSDDYIDMFSEKLKTKGYSYSDHCEAILKWWEKDKTAYFERRGNDVRVIADDDDPDAKYRKLDDAFEMSVNRFGGGEVG